MNQFVIFHNKVPDYIQTIYIMDIFTPKLRCHNVGTILSQANLLIQASVKSSNFFLLESNLN